MIMMSILEPFVDSLRLGPKGLTISGEQVGRGAAIRESRLGPELAALVYDRVYTRPSPEPEGDKPAESLLPALKKANSCQPRWEGDWAINQVEPGGSVIAARYDRTQRFAAGRYVVHDGMAAPMPGARVSVFFASDSDVLQPGFYYAFSRGFRDANDLSPLIRIYWNVLSSAAALLLFVVTSRLNQYEIPFEMKIATDPSTHLRADSAVLYIAQRHFNAAMLVLTPVMEPGVLQLLPAVPLFTKQLAPGVGLAEDPPGAESFGMARSRLVAEALIAARDADRFDFTRFKQHFHENVDNAGLKIEALWLNPGSVDLYTLPEWSAREDA